MSWIISLSPASAGYSVSKIKGQGPAEVDPGHVAAHAVRHLADLAQRDQVVREVARTDAALWRAVASNAGLTRHRLDQAS